MATILVIDDHQVNRKFLVTLLSYQKHQMLEAADGLQALKIIKQEPIDLIISDILMPNLDGYELAQMIRADKALTHIPIIFYTATYSTFDAKILANACGVNVVISKPSEPEEILNQVNSILGLTVSLDALVQDAICTEKGSQANFIDNLSVLLDGMDVTSQQLSQSSQNKPSYEDLVVQIKQLKSNGLKMSSLTKLGFNLIKERDPLRMFKLFGRAACKIIDAKSVTIGFFGNLQELAGSFCSTINSDQIETHYSDTCALADDVLRKLIIDNKLITLPVLSSEYFKDISLSQDCLNQSFLAIPILSDKKEYGIIYFIGKCTAATFSDEDKHIITTMAAELAVLYENIKLYDMIRQYAVQLQIEVNERKNIESELRHSEQRLQLALNSAQMIGWEWNIQINEVEGFGYVSKLDGTCRRLNKNRISLQQFIKDIHPHDRERIQQALNDSIELNIEYKAEYRLSKDKDTIEWIYSCGKVFYNEQGKPQYMLGVSINITDRKKSEQLMRQRQSELGYIARLSSMGEMASTLAHELNQPLTVINSYVSGCIYRLEKKPLELPAIIDVMHKTLQQVEMVGQIIHSMKNFVRDGELQRESLMINDIIQEAVALIKYEFQDDKISITFNPDTSLGLITVDKIQMYQVLLNLIRNAVEIMLEDRTINPAVIITTSYTTKTTTISVADNGPGISQNAEDSLFRPYFTQKNRGMGMGLAICYTIIEAHGGNIVAINLPKRGACFQFTLPSTHYD